VNHSNLRVNPFEGLIRIPLARKADCASDQNQDWGRGWRFTFRYGRATVAFSIAYKFAKRIFFAAFVAFHGAIHILGFVKGFGLAPVAQLQRSIGRPLGLLWLIAATGFLLAGALLLYAPRHWWLPAIFSLLLSQSLIISVWSDAKFGTVANVIVLVPLALALLDLRPGSLRSTYEREVDRGLARATATLLVTETDLTPLPELVATYLRRVGVVGKPRVRNFRAIFRAQMRSNAGSSWMQASAEQFNFYDEPSRLFLMKASRAGLPIKVLHRYVGSHATMQVRIGELFTVADARGPIMDQSETVTMLNDICLLAPAMLPFAPVTWESRDAHTVRAAFKNAGQTVHADLIFNEEGDLIDFVSNDRYATDGDTAISEYGNFRGMHLWRKGEARWIESSGAWTYGRFELLDVEYNCAKR
jgi:hypothetical protein